ncbi:transcription termination factor NusA [Candidatus Woesebacteria bacterium RIFCSPHIGHO2_01_FULL_41_10]|uniref:Transcription termination/antitermination protein NusA n=1 Tax=Candidatus Woesebacteria bacterium RIFCSPHIGHO2_01_FULL_41_10 TaxID=1802500 RepID=A0A1F7YPK4_9BACT|nr:MAG: transcription termination factor NusA [Candidatus Woesebacteria bacterium RIFCSPHIGHO2_01_FULL_41_10]
MATTKRTEFSQALKAIAQERGIDPEVIIDTIKQAYVAAYKRDARERGEEIDSFDYDAEIDPVNGEAKIIGWPLEEPDKRKDVTPPGFGRIAAQTAKQVIHQKIREAEKGVVMDEFGGRVGGLISGVVLRFDGPNVRVDLGKTEALMPTEERIPSERLSPSQRLTFLLKDIEDTPRGKQIILSRSSDEFVRKVFAREVPEISSGSVEIRQIAREPGGRTKIAVFSSQSGVDPVGSCVGQKGVRVQAVTNELGGERVDIIPWTENEEEFIKAAIAPVEVLGIVLNKEKHEATITVPEDQLSLAIGKDGQNVRLASKLTGWRIEVAGKAVEGAPKLTKKEEKEKEVKPEKQPEEKLEEQVKTVVPEETEEEEPKEENSEDETQSSEKTQ